MSDTHLCILSILDCSDTYKYEYNNICFNNSCPRGTYNSYKNKYICTDICDIYYNYNKTSCIEEIPEGYYLNDSIYKTIDKCNDKCKICNYESNKYNSCITCNNEGGYYEKEDEEKIDNKYVKCYKGILIIDNYYFDNNKYKPCYYKCKKCNKLGDKINNECTECYSNYTLNNTNCYDICPYYYFFDQFNEYHCTPENKCPANYKYLVKNTNECINSWQNEYKYVYDNTCYKSCPEKTYISNKNKYLCEKDCPEDNPYENENSECIQECNATNLFNNLCKIKNNKPTVKDNMMINIKNELLNGALDHIIKSVIEGKKKI